MAIYWFQSLIIGGFQVKKILDLKQFSTEGFTMNGKSVEPTEKTKRETAGFLVLHYGLFHFVYFLFLAPKVFLVINIFGLVAVTSFFINHLFSYQKNKDTDSGKIKNIGTMMFFPYARILPMHLMIGFAFVLTGSTFYLVVFLLLKTLADVIMHVVEHKT